MEKERALKFREIYNTIRADDIVQLRTFLEEGLSYNDYLDARGEFPLQTAADLGSPKCLAELLKAESQQPHAANQGLIAAVNEDHPECVQILLEFGVAPEGTVEYEIDSDGEVPLSSALAICNPRVVKMLVEANAVEKISDPRWLNEASNQVLKSRREGRDTSLLIYSRRLIPRILGNDEEAFSISIKKRLADQLLEISSRLTETEDIKSLAKTLIRNLDTETALQEEVLTLITEGEPEEITSSLRNLISSQSTPIQQRIATTSLPWLAAIANADDIQCWDLLKEFIEWSTDVNAVDDLGATALMYVSCDGPIELVQNLVKRGASLNKRDSEGMTALDHIIDWEKEHLPAFDFLKSKGAKTADELEDEK